MSDTFFLCVQHSSNKLNLTNVMPFRMNPAARLRPYSLLADERYLGLRGLRGGTSESDQDSVQDLLNNFADQLAPSLSDREVRRVARAAALDELRQKEAKSVAVQEQDSPRGDIDALAGWNPASLREFRSGIMHEEADGKRLRPLPDKGVLFLESSDADGMMHLIWKPRESPPAASASAGASSPARELDLLLLPGTCRFDRVTEFNGHPITGVFAIEHTARDTDDEWGGLDSLSSSERRGLVPPLGDLKG